MVAPSEGFASLEHFKDYYLRASVEVSVDELLTNQQPSECAPCVLDITQANTSHSI